MTQKMMVRLFELGKPWYNDLIVTRESLKEFLSKEHVIPIYDDFNPTSPPIGKAYNFKIDYNHIVCEIELTEIIVANSIKYKGDDPTNIEEAAITGISIIKKGNRVKE